MDEPIGRASKWDLLHSIDTSCGEVSDSLNGAADDIIAAIHEIRDLLRARATLPSGDWMSEIVDRVVEVVRARQDEPEGSFEPFRGFCFTDLLSKQRVAVEASLQDPGDRDLIRQHLVACDALIPQQDAEIARLRAEVREWEDAAQGAENPHPDEDHCSCVPLLSKRERDLRAEIDRWKETVTNLRSEVEERARLDGDEIVKSTDARDAALARAEKAEGKWIGLRDAITRKDGVRDVIQRIPPHPERAHALRILDAALAAPEPEVERLKRELAATCTAAELHQKHAKDALTRAEKAEAERDRMAEEVRGIRDDLRASLDANDYTWSRAIVQRIDAALPPAPEPGEEQP